MIHLMRLRHTTVILTARAFLLLYLFILLIWEKLPKPVLSELVIGSFLCYMFYMCAHFIYKSFYKRTMSYG